MSFAVVDLFAGFKLRPLQKLIFEKNWAPYVDDIFILWDADRLALDDFLHKYNNVDHNIMFTLEIAKDYSCPYWMSSCTAMTRC